MARHPERKLLFHPIRIALRFTDPHTELMPHRFEVSTLLPGASLGDVWSRVSRFAGVNDELSPVFRMTFPARFASLEAIPADGHCHLTSTILLFGFLPVDRHRLVLHRIEPLAGFDERSSNFNMKVWTHKRTLTPEVGGVRVTDECSLEPRIGMLGGLLYAIFSAVFAHRHRRLALTFSQKPG